MMVDLLAIERAFIGCLLRSSEAVWTVTAVKPEMLVSAACRDIYTAILDLAERGRRVSTATLSTHDAIKPEYPDEGGPKAAIIAVLRANAEDAGSAQDYADTITERYALRQIEDLGKWLSAEVRKPGGEAEELAARAAAKLQDIMSTAAPIRPIKLGEVTQKVVKRAGDAYQSGEPAFGLTTGIPRLDEIMGRMLAGDLIFLIASQSDGKSALAAQIASYNALAGHPVLYFQFEMSGDQMGARALAARSGVSVRKINEGQFDAFEYGEIDRAERELRDVPFYLIDTDKAEDDLTVRQIQALARAVQRESGLSLLVIDQLDKIKPEGRHRDRFERLAEITRDLNRLAKALQVPVLVLAQRTRGAQRRDDPTPDILDADAPSIERDAEVVIALWQHANWLRRQRPEAKLGEEAKANWETKMFQAKGQAEIICLKRRRGKAFEQCKLHFDGARMTFRAPDDDLPDVGEMQ